eukprot:TRINITY_DN1651_c0_g2_i3.p1 TRINITY_DN1651_c0_g2~~TRINITY_DN1651_c0_g2_i3.p1  ORF type:complete len:701 (+),score=237.55 TRINITY_DN1651_c0_g2_i3:68-2170(+)
MQFFKVSLLFLLATGVAASVSSTVTSKAKVHPIQRVISLIQDLKEKAKAEGIAEADTYEKYTHWCGKIAKQLNKAIKKENLAIDGLTSKVAGKTAEKELTEKEILALTKEISQIEKSAQEVKDSRDKAIDLYKATLKDFDDTIDALAAAIDGLVKSAKPAAAAALLQLPLVLTSLSKEDQEALISFAGSPLTGDPAARKYDFKSGNIINMLKKMKNEFTDQKAKLNADESAAATTYMQVKGVSDEQLTVANENKDTKTKFKAEIESTLASLTSDLSNQNEDLAADSKSLKDTQMSCKIKADEFKQRTYMRGQEQEALAYGIKILQKVTGVRSEVPASFLQVSKGDDKKRKLVELLHQQAKKFHSHAFQRLAEQAESDAPDVPTQLDLTIQKQIWALKDEQLAEDKKKAWCDLEINKTANSEKKKANEMNTLTDDIAVAEARVSKLIEEIAAAQKTVNDVKEQMYEASVVRQDEKTENTLAIEDAQDAQKALKDAIATLSKYYDGAATTAEEEALIQAPVVVEAAPAQWADKSYTGQGGQTNVIKILELTSADFAKMEADTAAKEESESTEFKKDNMDGNKEIQRRTTEFDLKSQEQTRLQAKIDAWKKSYKLTDRERLLLIQYGKDLDAECNGGEGGSYEDRKAARDEEKESLEGVQYVLRAAFEGMESLAKTKDARLLHGNSLAKKGKTSKAFLDLVED